MTENLVHRCVCGCDAGPACPLWDISLDAELAVRQRVDWEARARIAEIHESLG